MEMQNDVLREDRVSKEFGSVEGKIRKAKVQIIDIISPLQLGLKSNVQIKEFGQTIGTDH